MARSHNLGVLEVSGAVEIGTGGQGLTPAESAARPPKSIRH